MSIASQKNFIVYHGPLCRHGLMDWFGRMRSTATGSWTWARAACASKPEQVPLELIGKLCRAHERPGLASRFIRTGGEALKRGRRTDGSGPPPPCSFPFRTRPQRQDDLRPGAVIPEEGLPVPLVRDVLHATGQLQVPADAVAAAHDPACTTRARRGSVIVQGVDRVLPCSLGAKVLEIEAASAEPGEQLSRRALRCQSQPPPDRRVAGHDAGAHHPGCRRPAPRRPASCSGRWRQAGPQVGVRASTKPTTVACARSG